MDRKRIKILYISHSPYLYGAELCLFTLLKYLDRERFTPYVALPANGPLKEKLEGIGVKTFITPLVWWIPPIWDRGKNNQLGIMERCEKLTSLIQKEGIDIVQTNTSVVVEGAIAAKMAGKPHIWHLHEILSAYPSLKPSFPLYLTYRFIDLLSDSVVAVTQALKKAVSEGVNSENIKVIYNGIDINRQKKEDKSLRKELGIADDCLLVGTVGSIIKEKGHHAFLDAAKRVLDKGENIHFVVVGNIGDVDLFSSLLSKINDRSHKKHIKFLGYRDDVHRILEEIDIYVLSSETESFGLSLVEAMAVGKPVVATRCGGPEEIVADGETGLLVPVNNPEAMANAIINLSDDIERRYQMGLNGKKRYETLFTPDQYCKQFEHLYLGLSKRKVLDREQKKLANSLIELLINTDKARSTNHTSQGAGRNLKRLLRLGYYRAIKAIAKQIPP